jgi:HSP20 family protein
MNKRDKRPSADESSGQVGGLFKGLEDLIHRIGEIAEKGEGLSKSFDADGTTSTDKPFKAVYGFSVKVGRGGDGMKVEPFGTVRKPAPTAQNQNHKEEDETREPLVDVFEEQDGLHIIAEMPGVAQPDIKLEISAQTLKLTAESRGRKYQKEIELPRAFSKENAVVSCNNGMVEIHLR